MATFLFGTQWSVGIGEATENKKEISVGVLDNWPPIYLQDTESDIPNGFAIDIFRQVTKEIDAKFEYISYPSWSKLSEAYTKGEVQVIPSVGITPLRESIYLFSTPYDVISVYLFTRISNNSVNGISDLDGVPVGVVKENKGYYFAREISNIQMLVFNSSVDALIGLVSGKVDALIYPEGPLWNLAIQEGLEDEIVTKGPPLSEIKRAIAVSHDVADILPEINWKLSELYTNGKFTEIYNRWFKEPETHWPVKKIVFSLGLTAAVMLVLVLLLYLKFNHNFNKEIKAENRERRNAEEALRILNQRLDKKVVERTRQLTELIREKDELLAQMDDKERLIDQILKNTKTLISVHDLDGFFTYYNFPGNAKYPAVGHHISEFFPAKQAEMFLQRAQKVAETGKADVYESVIERENGSMYTIDEVSPVYDNSGNIVATSSFCYDVTDLKKANERLRVSESRFKELADLLPECVFETDINLDLTYVNQNAYTYFGFTEDEFKAGVNAMEFLVPECRDAAKENTKRRANGEALGIADYWAVRKNGTTFPVLAQTQPIIDKGVLVGFRGVMIDISEKKKSEELLRQNLKEKEVLLQEIHHRVKNNLTIVSSLLTLQLQRNVNPEIAEALVESKNRVVAMAAIHEALYQTSDLSSIELNRYIDGLAKTISQNYQVKGQIKLFIQGDRISIGVQQASPVGLIVNELLTNSYKYAFPDATSGEIDIKLSLRGNTVTLIYKDDGVGLPDDFIQHQDTTLGLNLIKILTENQLDGIMVIDNKSGTRFTIQFELAAS